MNFHEEAKMATATNVFLCVSVFTSIAGILVQSITLEEEFEGSRTLTLEHSISPDKVEFVKRGTLVIQSLKSNKAQFTAASALSEDDIDSIKELAKNDGLYRVRIPIKDAASGTPTYVSSVTEACGIVENGLNDEVTVSFDQSGEVLGVSIRGLGPACSGKEVSNSNLTSWKTSVEVIATLTGPAPDTQTYIEKMKRDEQEKLKNQDGDNRSFLSKYWMYIVPVVIMMVIMSSADQQAQGGGGR